MKCAKQTCEPVTIYNLEFTVYKLKTTIYNLQLQFAVQSLNTEDSITMISGRTTARKLI